MTMQLKLSQNEKRMLDRMLANKTISDDEFRELGAKELIEFAEKLCDAGMLKLESVDSHHQFYDTKDATVRIAFNFTINDNFNMENICYE